MNFGAFATSSFQTLVGFDPNAFMTFATSSVIQVFYGTIFSFLNHFAAQIIAWLMVFAIIYLGWIMLDFFTTI